MMAQAASETAQPQQTGSSPHERGIIPRMRFSLMVRLFALVVIAVLPAIGIQAYNEYDLRQSREADIRQRVVQITKQFGEEMGELREGARQLLLALGQLPSVKGRRTDECSSLFASLETQYANYSLLAAADTEGRIFCSSSNTYASVADTPFFTRAMSQEGVAVGNYYADPITGEKLIHFAQRFHDANGNVAGVVFAGLNLAWLSEHLKERGLSPTQSILIADREGNIIARLPNPEVLVGKNMRKSHEGIMDGDVAGWEESVGVDGVTRIFGYVPAQLPPYDLFLSAGQGKSDALAPIEYATRRGIGLILVGFLLAAYAAWLGGRIFIQRPINGLLEVAKAWRDGDEAARVHLDDKRSEIGRLGAAFNDMADALATRHAAQKRAEEELRQLNSTLEERVEQRTRELADANRLATLGKLTATVSHELRNPLAVIRNTVFALNEVVKKQNLGLDRSIQRINRNITRCTDIITELLDYTRTPKLDPVPRELDSWLAEILAEYEMPPGIELRRSLGAGGAQAAFDAGRLQRVFVNLLDNARDAIKETRTGDGTKDQSVTVDTRVAGRRLEIAVRDTGGGIPPEVFPKIFEPLFSTKGFGIGLGLPTVKQIMEHHRGGIEVSSRQGEGTTVLLWLPLAGAQEIAA
jgi:signal transduction histidine kinase